MNEKSESEKIASLKSSKTLHFMPSLSGLYYKIIMTIVSDDRMWTLYYKFFTTIVSALPLLALATVVNYDCKWCSKLWRHLPSSFWWL